METHLTKTDDVAMLPDEKDMWSGSAIDDSAGESDKFVVSFEVYLASKPSVVFRNFK